MMDTNFLKTTYKIIIILFFLNGVVYADEWYEIYQTGISELARGEWKKARQSFLQALTIKPEPEVQATTSGLKIVNYLPHYYLGQTYLYTGEHERALQSFDESNNSGEIDKTRHIAHLNQLQRIARRLLQAEKKSRRLSDFEQKISTLQNLVENERQAEAESLLNELKQTDPDDPRLAVFTSWIQKNRQSIDAKPLSNLNQSSAANTFDQGLDRYLLGQFEQALADFRAAQKLDPDFGSVSSWIRKTEAELKRLKLAAAPTTTQPVIIEKIIRQTTAPVFAIRTPNEIVSTSRSKILKLSGQIGDDHGIAYIEITLNGKPLLKPSGERVAIRPAATDDPAKFSFTFDIPLQMGENQIVLTAYDIDSPPKRSIEQLSVIRKPPIYQTSTFRMAVGSLFLLGIGGLILSRRIKYRIAIINKYNPYIAGSPIRTEEMFFGREKLVKRILNTIHNNSLMIYGQRRIGKTSLQHHLKNRLETLQDPEFHFIPVMIDLQGTSEDHFFATLMEEILDVCKSKLNGQIDFRFYQQKENYSSRDLSRDLKTLLGLLKATTSKKLKLVLLIDEVDELNKYSEQVNQKLRSIFMKTFAENLVAVMFGAYIRKSWESEGSPWYNFFEEMEVPPLSQENATQLIRDPVKGIFSYDDDAIKKIIEYSEGKPYIVQKFCVHVINRIIEEKRRNVTLADVERIALQVMNTVEAVENSSGK